METPIGLFKGENITLDITNTGKDFSGMVTPWGNMKPTDIGAFFNLAAQDAVGKCVLTKAGTALDCNCSFKDNILTVTHSSGYSMLFCFKFGLLYLLDPEGAMLIVLRK